MDEEWSPSSRMISNLVCLGDKKMLLSGLVYEYLNVPSLLGRSYSSNSSSSSSRRTICLNFPIRTVDKLSPTKSSLRGPHVFGTTVNGVKILMGKYRMDHVPSYI